MFFGDLPDAAHHLREGVAGDRDVFADPVRRKRGHGGTDTPPDGPELFRLLLRPGRAERDGAALFRSGFDSFRLGFEGRVVLTVDFDDDACANLRIDFGLAVACDNLQTGSVHDLGCGRQNARLKNRVDGPAAVVKGAEHHLQRAAPLRHRDQPEEGLGDDAEGALGTGEEARQVIAGHVLDRLAAGLENRAVGQNHLQPHDVVLRHTIFYGPHSAGVFRHVAADGGEFPARRVGRKEEPLFGAVVVEVDCANTGLRRHHHVAQIELDDLRHAVEAEGDAALLRNASTGAAAPGASWRYGDFMRAGYHHDPRYLIGGQRSDDQVGVVLRQKRHKGGVVGIAESVQLGIEDVVRPNDCDNFLLDHF